MFTLVVTYLSAFLFIFIALASEFEIDPRNTLIWGPGLYPDKIVMPARYFFIQAIDINGNNLTKSPGEVFQIKWIGHSSIGRQCRIWLNQLDRNDGTFIIRYKLYHTCFGVEIHIKHKDNHVANSPYQILNIVQPEECNCPEKDFQQWLDQYKCKKTYEQINRDLQQFTKVNFNQIRSNVIEKYHNPSRTSFCNYIIKKNQIYRKCYGQHVGFKMFIDAILLSLTRKAYFPDFEFFVNLGDWPLVQKSNFASNQKLDNAHIPIFSWCGSENTMDIVLPTYDITESSLENMGRVMLDMLSVQSHAGKIPWENKIPKLFWRGRDSRRERLQLINIAREHPDLFNVSLTNFFFFRDKEEEYGPKTKHISFFDFFEYKYQLNIDGTVAAYRFPYLLAGNSLIFKQNSEYYEFFYKDLQPMVHYIPVLRNLSDLLDKIKWVQEHDEEAFKISQTGQKYAQENLLPHDIFCYHAILFKEWSAKIISPIEVISDMEHVPQLIQDNIHCNCVPNIKLTRDEF